MATSSPEQGAAPLSNRAASPDDTAGSNSSKRTSRLEPPPLLSPIPGTKPRKRFRPRIDWELFSCGLHGHELVGADAGLVDEEHASYARDVEGIRWLRCLRCDAWVPLEGPVLPGSERLPAPEALVLPVRGRQLRDRYVLRLIVVDRCLHILVLSALAVAIFLFAQDKASLHHTYLAILNGLQQGVGGPSGSTHAGLVGDVNRLFALSRGKIYLVGAAVSIYTALLVLEAVGLWNQRRWAEYLTLIETGLLVPFEIYELTSTISALKMLTLVINLAIVLYLLLAHRLFGLRGGRAAAVAEYGSSG
jgi:uncharacterized membrane protein (DUF2068 family)